MAEKLVIVESPAKARTISRFLGPDYKVLASMGHVRDLPKSKLSVDTEHDFEPVYIISKDKKKVVDELKKEYEKAKSLWLATDEDREGEAIGWHLLHALKVNKNKTPVYRIVFHEITEGAIKDAVMQPRDIDQNVVDAQQARRVLDRLVGYELSPFLWKKVRYGLSAGRVQSVAVRFVVEREREIQAFKPEEYWSIAALFKEGFEAELFKKGEEKVKIGNETDVKKIESELSGVNYQVAEIEEKQVKRHPAPPFITSTLQQEASRKLNFSVKKTMMVAQQLYEGVDTGGGETGLITYMRTDSVNLAESALRQAKEVIEKDFGKEFALDEPRRYKVQKGAQAAHEAIRPVDLSLKPEDAGRFLSRDQARLYELIWKRTLACQMREAILNKTTVDISAGDYVFRATGQSIAFAGFIRAYIEDIDEDDAVEVFGEKILPKMEKGQQLNLEKLRSEQHFTKPPARYTEASLVKKLESEGIGRPSTYAPTIGTIVTRGYIEKDGKALIPTDLAMMVTDVLVEHFSDIVDYKFTAEMEDKLDKVEEGALKWVPMIREFYVPFHANVEKNTANLTTDDVFAERVLGTDPKTGLPVVVRHGRFGPFVQIGQFSKEEVKEMVGKPRRASLPKGIYVESATLEDALKALSLPRILGVLDGEEVIVMDGRFGPYMKIGKDNFSLPKEKDPHTIALEEVKGLIAEAKEKKKKFSEPIKKLGKDPESGGEILVKEGRYGPYVTDGTTNASLKKGAGEPANLTFEQAVEILAKKRKMPKRAFRPRKKT